MNINTNVNINMLIYHRYIKFGVYAFLLILYHMAMVRCQDENTSSCKITEVKHFELNQFLDR